jgi:hypothetical protein
VRAAVAFLADDPQNWPARRGEQAPRPLDGRGVDSVLRVAETDARLPARVDDLVAGCQDAAEHLGPRGRGKREAARERLLDNHVLAGPGRRDGQRRVERRGRAEKPALMNLTRSVELLAVTAGGGAGGVSGRLPNS